VPIAFFVVSIPEVIPFLVESIILDAVSVVEDTEVESAEVEVLLELQAATDIVTAKAKKPNLDEFFMLCFLFLRSEILP